MPENLRQAHERNDEVLERIYIGRRFKNDTERLEKLFDLYTKMVAKPATARQAKAALGQEGRLEGKPHEPTGDRPASLTPPPQGYAEWLAELKRRIHTAQQRATLAVNRELVLLYWQIGRDILARQAEQGWGAKVIDRLAKDLRAAFPDMKGFSPRNLKYMRAFADAWPDAEFVQGVLAQLPWYHQLALLDKLPGAETRRWYAAKADRAQLVAQRAGDADRDPAAGAQRPGRHQLSGHAARAAVRPGARIASRTRTASTSSAWATRRRSARSNTRWCATSPSSCWSWARASPSSAGRCCWTWAATSSSSTCCSIT